MFSLLQRHSLKSAKLPINSIGICRNYASHDDLSQSNAKSEDNDGTIQGFRVLKLHPKAQEQSFVARTRQNFKVGEHRYKKMKIDQDWGAVWPGPKTFHPSSVPLPLRQGFVKTKSKILPSPDKFVNAELMKIPNFLHLTPPVVKKQCEAIKKFCTPWPKGLETDEECEEHFPIEYVSTDYCHGLPTIRNPLARIIALRFKLESLKLDAHAKDKFLRLIGKRYDQKTDYVTITVDRCPTRKQNFEYAQYLITALYHEAHIVEPWEGEKLEADMEYYDWQNNVSKKAMEEILRWGQSPDTPIQSTDEYAKSVEKIFNEEETKQNLLTYKEEVVKLLGLKK